MPAESLNTLIVRADESQQLDRNDMRLWITAKGEVSDKAPGFLIGRLVGKPKSIVVRTNQTTAPMTIDVESRHTQSGISATARLVLTLQTPGKSDQPMWKVLGEVFGDRDLVNISHAQTVNGDTPEAVLRRGISGWLRTELNNVGDPSRQLSPDSWSDWERRIAGKICSEFGLIAKVGFQLKPETTAEIELPPVSVTSTTLGGSINVLLGVATSVGALDPANPYAVRALTVAELCKIVEDVCGKALRTSLTLTEIRLGRAGWSLSRSLQDLVDAALRPYGRKTTSFQLQVSQPKHSYGDAEYAVRVEHCYFEPAGWRGQGRVEFRADIKAHCTSADLFEPLIEGVAASYGTDATPVTDFLETRLKAALQDAISQGLFDIHDDKLGYADLLLHWEDTYKKNIETLLTKELAKLGWSNKPIIARPARDEVNLVGFGVEIALPDLLLPAKATGTEIGFGLIARVRARSFNDIREILNNNAYPLEYIRDKIIKPACEELARQTEMLEYFQHFEPIPGDTSAIGDPKSFVERVEGCLEAALKKQGLILMEGISVKATPTNLSKVWSSIRSQRILPVQSQIKGLYWEGKQHSFTLEFTAQIDGIHEKGWPQFAGYPWRADGEADSDIQAIIERAMKTVGERFVADDVPYLINFNATGELRRDFNKLVDVRLNQVLQRTLGLTARLTHATRLQTDAEAADAEIGTYEVEKYIEIGKSKLDAQRKVAEVDHVSIVKRAIDETEHIDTLADGEMTSKTNLGKALAHQEKNRAAAAAKIGTMTNATGRAVPLPGRADRPALEDDIYE